jgi:WD40 repeat protein
VEQPYQQTSGKKWDALEMTLTDLFFIEAKCKIGLALALLKDYQFAGLIPNSYKTAADPVFNQSLLQFAEFVQREIHVFIRFPEIVFQQAQNWPDWSSPSIAAKQFCSEHRSSSLLWLNKPQQLDSCISTLTLKSSGNTVVNNYVGLAPQAAYAYAVHNSMVCLFDLRNSTEKTNFYLPSSKKIIKTNLSENGKWLITMTEDRNVDVWDTFKATKLFEIHLITGQNCSFSTDGQRILTCMFPGIICVWDVEVRSIVSFVKSETANPDINSLEDEPMIFSLSDDKRYAATGISRSGEITLWDLPGSRVIKEFKGNKDWLYACCFSRDGKQLITVGGDSYLKVWNVADGNMIASLPVPPLSANSAHTPGGYGGIGSCAFSHDGRFIVLGCWDCSIRLWDATDLKSIRIFKGHGAPVLKCGFSENDSEIYSASSDGVVKCWNISHLTENEVLYDHNGMVTRMYLSQDERFIRTESNDFKQLVLDFSFNPPIVRQFNELDPADIKKIPDYHWQPVEKKVRDGERVFYAARSPDGMREATYSVASQSVHLIDNQNKTDIAVLDGPEIINKQIKGNLSLLGVTVCQFSRDSRLLLTASEDCTLKIWSARNGELLCVFPTAAVVSAATFCLFGKVVCAGDAAGNIYALNIEIKKY